MSKTAAATNESLVDYSTVTKKQTLVDRVLELQRQIREKEEKLASEQALRSEFQSLISQSERNEQAATVGKQAEQSENQQKSGNKRREGTRK